MATSITERIKKFRRNLNLTKTLKLIWSLAPGRTVGALSFIIIESMLWFGTLFTLKLLIDSIALKDSQGADFLGNTMKLILLAGIIAVLYNCVKAYSSYLSDFLGAKISQALDIRIHEHTIGLDLSYYESPEYLDILKRAREAGGIHPFSVVVSLFDLIRNLLMMAALGSVLITIDWMLMPILALFVLPILLVRVKFSDKMYAWQRQQTQLERKSSYLSGLITGDASAKEVRAFSLGKFFLDQYTGIRESLLGQQMQLNKRRTWIEMATMVTVTSAFYAITAYIVFGAMKGETSVGDIAVFLVIFPQTFTLMQTLAAAISKLYQGNIYVANIFELFELRPKLFEPKHIVPVPTGNNLDFVIDRMHFKYPHADQPALVNVSMKIPAGKIVALVGLNGAGKSTFIKLLCRLYDPVKGSIMLGDTDIKQFDTGEYRKQISTVFQDFVRYNVTARDCIRYGDIDGDTRENDLREAAVNSGANEFIETFPQGYDTMMGRVFDEGHEVSTGQWQKLAIARSFYSNSRLIIFDEATSALDAKSESELFRTFRERIGSRSALVISHRLSTVRHADYIYVMADKGIMESGTHEQLMAVNNGVYARLFQTHLEKQDVAEV